MTTAALTVHKPRAGRKKSTAYMSLGEMESILVAVGMTLRALSIVLNIPYRSMQDYIARITPINERVACLLRNYHKEDLRLME